MDKALQDAAKRTELESQRMDLDNKKWAPKIDESRIGLMQKRPYDSYQGFTKEVPEDKAADVYADVSHGDRYEYEGHPGPRIESLLARRKFVHEYDKASREEYVRQFLANALKEGYLIQLNDQLEVVRVQRVPTDLPLALPPGSGTPYQDQRPSPFDSGYSGSQ